MTHIHIALNEILQKKNISKRTVCRECSLQFSQLNRYCSNTLIRIDLGVVARLCAFLDCTPNDLFVLCDKDPLPNCNESY